MGSGEHDGAGPARPPGQQLTRTPGPAVPRRQYKGDDTYREHLDAEEGTARSGWVGVGRRPDGGESAGAGAGAERGRPVERRSGMEVGVPPCVALGAGAGRGAASP